MFNLTTLYALIASGLSIGSNLEANIIFIKQKIMKRNHLKFERTEPNNGFGKCTRCRRQNISPTWYQSCDPKEAIKGWTSGNRNIDKTHQNFSKKRYKI
ncbi:hypothetical protein C2G38_143689 [Gigaspora rosea]|uniref:Secreted protein n=1 Tax=Gigaspora rosea TaxID=44941 RepID=A0A397W0R1_9GLOM|nr:hypothetical protein C2G38_143689 [Gigaspora rosea]